MRTVLRLGTLPMLFVLAAVAAAADPAWLTNRDKAMEQAKKDSKFVLVDFTVSDATDDCAKLRKEVFGAKEFKDWAGKRVVLLEVDLPKKKKLADEVKKQNEELQKKYGVKEFPAVVFVNLAGDDVARVGYVKGGAKEWIKAAEEALKDAKPDATKAAADGVWLESFDKAAAAARSSGHPILADFTGSDWCGWCIKLRQEVFDTQQFKDWAAKTVVLLEVDFPRGKPQSDEVKAANQKLQAKYGIEGYPTIVFLDADGNKLGESGYKPGGPSAWIPDAQAILDAGKK